LKPWINHHHAFRRGASKTIIFLLRGLRELCGEGFVTVLLC
jgi:hypothetical protein